MYKPDNVFRVFHNAIGNKRHNDYDDVSNAKHKFKRLGYYKDAVKNGYIDESLIKSITSYQRDNDLNIDGYMMPGGETETHMYGDLLGLPKSTMRDDNRGFKTAIAAPVIPAIFGAGVLIHRGKKVYDAGKAAKKLWDIWKSAPVEGRQEELRKVCEGRLNEDLQECSLRYPYPKNKQKYEICRQTAMSRYARCLGDGPNGDIKPPIYGD
jgi:hypothetical protein